VEVIRAQAEEWLHGQVKCPETVVATVWARQEGRPILDLLAEVFAMASSDAKQLLADARDPATPVAEQVPALLTDAKQPIFFRANLGLAYAKALCDRRLFDEALTVLHAIKADQVADPAAYYFHRAVAEHRTLHKNDASRSIGRLLDDVADVPERYKMLAALMFLDMQQWKAKDLGDISRQMEVIQDRLGNGQGGPKTRKKQQDVVARLDELIKRYENAAKNPKNDPNDRKCPDGQPSPGDQPGDLPVPGTPVPGTPRAGDPNAPQDQSRIGLNRGDGTVTERELNAALKEWGKLPEKERARILTAIVRSMPPAYRQMIEDYYRKCATCQVP